jgi:hypothetical protein
VNDLYKENYKLLKKEIKDNYGKWKDLPCLWISRMNIEKNLYITKSENLHVQWIPIKIPMAFITETEKSTLKYV